MPADYNEPALLQQVAEGSEDAFRQLFDAYQRRLYSYALKITGSPEITEDIVQDIFLQLWTMRNRLPGIQNLNAYLHKSASHAAYRSLQRLAKEELVIHYLKIASGAPDPDGAANAFHQVLSKEIRGQVQQLVGQLTPRQREVFLLSRENGLKNEEIARRLGIGYESVKSHLADALRFLRRELKKQYGWQATAIFVVYRLGNH